MGDGHGGPGATPPPSPVRANLTGFCAKAPRAQQSCAGAPTQDHHRAPRLRGRLGRRLRLRERRAAHGGRPHHGHRAAARAPYRREEPAADRAGPGPGGPGAHGPDRAALPEEDRRRARAVAPAAQPRPPGSRSPARTRASGPGTQTCGDTARRGSHPPRPDHAPDSKGLGRLRARRDVRQVGPGQPSSRHLPGDVRTLTLRCMRGASRQRHHDAMTPRREHGWLCSGDTPVAAAAQPHPRHAPPRTQPYLSPTPLKPPVPRPPAPSTPPRSPPPPPSPAW